MHSTPTQPHGQECLCGAQRGGVWGQPSLEGRLWSLVIEKGGLFFSPGILPSTGSVLTSKRSLRHRPALSEHLSSLAITAFLCCVQCCEGLAEVERGRPVSWPPASARVWVVVECVLFLVMSLCLLNFPKYSSPKAFQKTVHVSLYHLQSSVLTSEKKEAL